MGPNHLLDKNFYVLAILFILDIHDLAYSAGLDRSDDLVHIQPFEIGRREFRTHFQAEVDQAKRDVDIHLAPSAAEVGNLDAKPTPGCPWGCMRSRRVGAAILFSQRSPQRGVFFSSTLFRLNHFDLLGKPGLVDRPALVVISNLLTATLWRATVPVSASPDQQSGLYFVLTLTLPAPLLAVISTLLAALS